MKKTSKSYKFKFSFVMPIYNVEEYLAETIESIVGQTMDFERNVEIILVNDGSPDSSEAVCLRYQRKFPKNIKYIKQKNQGVSVARNRGIEEVEGKYVSFLDSDDKLSPDTLDEVYDFFEQHYDEIDFVAIRLIFFEAKKGEHPLNYKFTKNRVVNIERDFQDVQLSGASAFVKSEVFEEGFGFDPVVGHFAEDTKFIAELALKKGSFGVVARPVYYYRRRLQNNSAIDGSTKSKVWHLDTPREVYQALFQYAKSIHGTLPKYIQYLVMYDLQWRFRQPLQTVLDAKEQEHYKTLLFELVSEIDDDIILSQKNLSLVHKLFILSKKYSLPATKKLRHKDHKLYYDKIEIADFKKTPPSVHIEFVTIKNDTMTLEGFFDWPLADTAALVFYDGLQYVKVSRKDNPHKYIRFLGEVISERNCFAVDIPIHSGIRIAPYITEGDGQEERTRVPLRLITHKFSRLDQTVGRAYCVDGRYIILKRPRFLEIEAYKKTRHIIRELKYEVALLQSKKLAPLLIRIAYFFLKPFHRGKIWIVSDRVDSAGDNGEAVFRYINTHPVNAKVYFAISKKSTDFKRLSQYGKVVDRDGWYYRFLFLYADKLVSAHAEDFVINAFGKKERNLRDLYTFDFVFLQHGITKDDISGWLNKSAKNIKLFVAAAKPEYESLLTPSYGYSEEVVKLTGFPRYDFLKNEPKKKLVITPTWRNYLAGRIDPQTGLRPYSETFTLSDYYNFFQSLIENDRLKETLVRNGMTGEFYLHPSLSPQIADFRGNDVFDIKSIPYDYKAVFAEGSIMLTDYSSVAFDFAYLQKPVVYTHFDKRDFYQGHTYDKGYFSYEDNGFGPVTYNLEDTVTELIRYIETGCTMEKKYVKRTEKFFYKVDRQNSKRVVDSIMDMES